MDERLRLLQRRFALSRSPDDAVAWAEEALRAGSSPPTVWLVYSGMWATERRLFYTKKDAYKWAAHHAQMRVYNTATGGIDELRQIIDESIKRGRFEAAVTEYNDSDFATHTGGADVINVFEMTFDEDSEFFKLRKVNRPNPCRGCGYIY